MVRAKNEGVTVPRWGVGSLRVVRGHLYLKDELVPELSRHCRVARLALQDTTLEPPDPLYDVSLVHASDHFLVLVGFERIGRPEKPTHVGQTWVLSRPEGEQATAFNGPRFPQ